jgi:hypothetical protein
MELIAGLDQQHADFVDQLYAALEARYQTSAGSPPSTSR